MRVAFRSPPGSRFEHVVFFERGRTARRTRRTAESSQSPPRAQGERLDESTNCERTFLRWVFREAGLNADCYRPETLHRRIPACLRELRVTNLSDARRLIERDRGQLSKAIGALVIGVTSFFRDPQVFDVLAATVLPALRKPPHACRVWSAGCSDGEELYSVAILLAEAGLLRDSNQLLGTDCRGPAIARAREGAYDATALRSVPSQWWHKHFVRDETRVRMAPRIRATVHWRVADATQICEPGAWDVILCRNMAMYMQSNVAAALWRKFEQALRPGGFLVLGKAERPIGARGLAAVAPCIYRRN